VSALEDFGAPEVPEEPVAREAWRVDGPNTADWCLRKLAVLRAEEVRDAELAEAEVKRIRTWQYEQVQRRGRSVSFFEGRLEQWMRLARPDERTVSLPHGSLHLRKAPDRVDIVDLDALRLFSAESPAELMRWPEPEADKRAIAAHIKETGEKVPGVVLVVGEDHFKAVPATGPGADE